ncbi:MAG: FHA domain-containing protein [Cyanobacteria bacterium P01_C01_bin.70]
MITLSLLHPLNKKPVQHWTFEEDTVIRIGRSTENQVVLYSAVVSRHHVELRQTDAGWEIVNLGTNGTYLDGKRVAQAIAEDGIIIRLARSGPNIQINIAEDSSDPMKALRKLKTEAESRTQIDISEPEEPASPMRPTRIDEEQDGLSSVQRSI